MQNTQSDLKSYSCPICNDEGYIIVWHGDEPFARECSCMKYKKILQGIQKSGLSQNVESYTFDSYKAREAWQEDILSKARAFTDTADSWFFIGGQVGAGKTHICVAILMDSITKGKKARYMLWRDEIMKLKSAASDSVLREDYIKPFKTCEILYIDDFLKTSRSALPTDADITTAFEILNYRYGNNLQTILSSEKTIAELLAIDEGTASRIVERCGEYCIDIPRDIKKNQRLKAGR